MAQRTNKKRLTSLVLSGQASEADYEALGVDEVLAIKANPENVNFRDFTGDEVKALGKRTFRFGFSSEKPDRSGDILKASGWVLDDFKANPVVLWGHDGRSHPPIGRVVKIEKGIDIKGAPGLGGEIEFAPEGISELIDTVHALVSTGFLKATSVGFMVMESREIRDEDERANLGLGRFGLFSTKQRLKEVSMVSIGAHQDALKRECDVLLSKELVTRKGVEDFLKTAITTEKDYARAIKELTQENFHIDIPWIVEEEKVEPDWSKTPEDVLADAQRALDKAKAAMETGSKKKPDVLSKDPQPVTVEVKLSSVEGVEDFMDLARKALDDSQEEIKRLRTENATMKGMQAFMEMAKKAVADAQAEMDRLREESSRLADTNKKQAMAIYGLADAVADLTERVLQGGPMPSDPARGGARDPDAGQLDAIAAELSGLADRAHERVRQAIHLTSQET